MFAVLCAIAAVSVNRYLPETKGVEAAPPGHARQGLLPTP